MAICLSGNCRNYKIGPLNLQSQVMQLIATYPESSLVEQFKTFSGHFKSKSLVANSLDVFWCFYEIDWIITEPESKR